MSPASPRPRPPRRPSHTGTSSSQRTTTQSTTTQVSDDGPVSLAIGAAVLLGIAYGAALLITPASFHVGHAIASSLMPYDSGPDGGGPDGGDTHPVTESVKSHFWLCLLYLAIFFVAVMNWIATICRFPYRPDWLRHSQFKGFFRFQPPVFLAITYATNFLPTWVIKQLYTPRVFATYAAALLAVLYLIAFRLRAPVSFRSVDPMLEHSGLSEQQGAELLLFPNSRAAMTVVATISILISTALTVVLLPAPLVEAPDNWWSAIVPW